MPTSIIPSEKPSQGTWMPFVAGVVSPAAVLCVVVWHVNYMISGFMSCSDDLTGKRMWCGSTIVIVQLRLNSFV